MMVLAGDWIKSEYITIDDTGWHCSEDAPDEIKKEYKKFMEQVNSGVKVIDPEE